MRVFGPTGILTRCASKPFENAAPKTHKTLGLGLGVPPMILMHCFQYRSLYRKVLWHKQHIVWLVYNDCNCLPCFYQCGGESLLCVHDTPQVLLTTNQWVELGKHPLDLQSLFQWHRLPLTALVSVAALTLLFEADTERRKLGLPHRVNFLGRSPSEPEYVHAQEVKLHGQMHPSCQTATFQLKVRIYI